MEPATALGLVAVVVLILLNGYFVAAEFAFVAVKRARLEVLAAEGDKRARRAVAVLGRLSFMLSGAQLGITVTSLLVGFIAEPSLGAAIAPLLTAVGLPESSASGVALSIGFVIATAAQMIIGELAPKNLAIARPEPVARALGSSTLVFMRVAGPVITLFDSSANRLLRLLGIEPVEELEGGVSADELELIVAESHAEGHLDEGHAGALLRALEFGDLDAGAVSVPLRDVVAVAPTDTLATVVRLAYETGHSRFPVLDGASGVALGIVGTRDLLEVPRDRWAVTTVASRAQTVPAVPDTSPLTSVLDVLRDAHSQSAVVIGEHGTVTGLITFEDLVEELVGEIRDEHDPPQHPAVVVASGEGRWAVAGRARLDEVERETGVDLPEGDYDTVAGLVVAELGRFAQPGDVVDVMPHGTADDVPEPVWLEVIDVDGYLVTHVVLSLTRQFDQVGQTDGRAPPAVDDPRDDPAAEA
ncbi:MAG TPA: hemolysin family protein [Euzebya sp.]|nr:hemolysin family protein [Euzebya sp.]